MPCSSITKNKHLILLLVHMWNCENNLNVHEELQDSSRYVIMSSTMCIVCLCPYPANHMLFPDIKPPLCQGVTWLVDDVYSQTAAITHQIVNL